MKICPPTPWVGCTIRRKRAWYLFPSIKWVRSIRVQWGISWFKHHLSMAPKHRCIRKKHRFIILELSELRKHCWRCVLNIVSWAHWTVYKACLDDCFGEKKILRITIDIIAWASVNRIFVFHMMLHSLIISQCILYFTNDLAMYHFLHLDVIFSLRKSKRPFL